MSQKINQSKIKFRKIILSDLILLKMWRNSSDIFPYNTQYSLLNMENQKKWFSEQKKSNENKMFMVIFNNQPIGICGLIHFDHENKNADVAIIIGETQFHGQGIGKNVLLKLITYGFKKLNLNRIGAEIFEYNKISENLFCNLNFIFECTLRQSLWRNGKWWNINKFSILKHEFDIL